MPEATPAVETPVAPRRYEIPVLGETIPEAPLVQTPPAAAEVVAKDDQDTGEQAPPAKPEAQPAPEEVTPEQAAKREGRRFGRKLDKAIRRGAEAQARAELAERRLAELEKPKAPEGEPKLEQFDYDPEKYAQAKADYAKSQAAKEFEAKQRTEAGQQQQQKLISDWEEKAERGADKYPDWEERVGNLKPDTPFLATIMEADNGDDLAHYLGTHEKEFKAIAQLQQRQAIFKLGLLAAKLALTPEKPKAPSKAPAPITPLTGVAAVASPEPSEQDNMGDWMKKRQKQVYGKR